MFKGIVIEVKENYIIVMKQDGGFEKIKAKGNPKVGDNIFFLEEDIYEEVKVSNKNKKWLIPILTIAALFMLIFNPLLSKFTIDANAYAVLTIDINPSIEIFLDNEGKIASITGENDEGASLNIKEIKGLTLDEGLSVLRGKLNDSSYIKDKTSVLVGFSFLKEEDISFEDLVQKTLKKYFNDKDVAFLKGSKADLEIANEKNMTLGKYEALTKLNEDDFEDALENLSTAEILDLLKNKDGSIFLKEDLLEEIEDELEDRREENIQGLPNSNNNDDDDDDHDNNDDSGDDDHDDNDDQDDDNNDDDDD